MVVNVALIVVRFDATSRGHHGVIWGWGLRGRMNYNGPGEQWEKSADVQVEDNTNVTTNEMTVQMNCLRLLVTGFKLINSLHGTRSQPWGLKQIWRVDHYFKTVFILTIICWQWPPENKLHIYIYRSRGRDYTGRASSVKLICKPERYGLWVNLKLWWQCSFSRSHFLLLLVI